MGTLKIDITGDNSNVLNAFNGVQEGVTKMRKVVEESGLSIEQTFHRIQNAAKASLAGFTAKEFVQSVAQIRGEFQQLEVAFKTMLGSAEKASTLMAQLTRTAAITPFGLQDVAGGAKQLLAYGTAMEEVNDTLIHLGDIAAGLSIPLNDLVMLYGTTMTQGRMFTQDLRQFMGRGIPLAEELAKQFGVTKDKVGELVTAGKVGAEEFKKALMALSSEGGKFAGLMEAQSKTITGQISNIEDAIDTMFNEIGKQSEGIINGTLDIITSLVENWESVGAAILAAAEAYGIYKATLMAMTAYNNSITNISYDAEIASLAKLLPMKEAEADADLQIAVAEGRLSASKAEAIASMRMEAQEQLKALAVKETAAKAEYKSALEKHLMAQRNMAVAQSQVKIAMESGTAEEVVAAKRGAATAKLELQNAAIAKNTAQKNLNTISTQKNALSNGIDAAASAGNTAATGVLTAAKMGLKRAIDAVNASFLASPLFWIAAVIAGVTFAVYKLVTAETAEAAARRKANEQIDEFNKKLDEQEAKIKEHIATIKSETATEYQKVKAYEQLKQLMPSLTDEYSRAEIAALDMVDAEQKINEAMDDAEFEDAKAKVEGYREAVERVKKSMEDDARYNGGKNAIFNLGQLERAEADLAEAEKRLRKIQELRAKAAEEMREEAKPIEIRVQEANENYQTKKEILAFYDEAMVLAHRVESANDKIDYEAARSDFDAFISKVEADIKELEEQIEKDPWNPKLEIEKKEKERMYNELVAMKDSWRGIFASPITVWFQAKYTNAKEAEEKARGDRKGMRFDGPTGKYVPLEEEISRTPKEWLKLKKKAWDDAQKELDDYLNGPGKSSDAKNNEEIERLKEAVSKAKKAYEEAGGSTGKSKAEEQAKETAARHQKQLEEEWKYQDELKRIKEQGADAAADAEIAAEKDAAVRERLERKTQHDRKIKELEGQEADIYKAIYEQRKKAYEAANKGKYTDTKQGALGWGKEAMKGTFTKEEQEYFDARYAIIKAWIDKENAEWERGEEERMRQLIAAHQSYTDKRLEIEEKYKKEIEAYEAELAALRAQYAAAGTEEEKKAIQEKIDQVIRSMGQAAKDQIKSLSETQMSELQDSPLFSLAWKDLESVSTETLNMLIAKFKELEGQFSGDPQAMKEWTERIKAMSDEVQSRNPFTAMYQAQQELDAAIEKRDTAKKIIEETKQLIPLIETRIAMKKAAGFDTTKDEKLLAEAREKLAKATGDLGEAEIAVSNATSKQKTAWAESRRQVDELASAISALGDEIGGEAGRILNLIGSVMTFATTTADGIKKVSDTAGKSIGAMEKASVILTIIAAAIQLVKQISDLIPDDHGQYEKYANKQKDIRKLTDAVHEYELAVLEARNAERNWFASSELNSLSNQWLVSSKASENYFKKLNELQATYQNESGSGWLTKLGAQANKTIASITGAVNKAFGLDDTFLGDLKTKGMQAGWAGVAGGPIGTALYAENDLWNKGWDVSYVKGLTVAWKNLRIETEKASKGFLGTGAGGHSQRTENLVDWVKEKLGLDLFDKDGWLNDKAYETIMKNYEDKLVGETKETLEALKELKEKHDEFLEQLHEYVDSMYSPIVNNFVDAMWAWYDEGKDALDSFEEAASQTFRNIVSDMMKTVMLKSFASEMGDKISSLYEDYFDKGNISYEELMAGVTEATGVAMAKFKEAVPMLKDMMTAMDGSLKEIGIDMQDLSSGAGEAFTSMSDAFKSALLDMEGDAEDFSKNVKKILFEALVNRFVFNSDAYNKMLEDYKEAIDQVVNATKKSGGEWLTGYEDDDVVQNRKDAINAALDEAERKSQATINEYMWLLQTDDDKLTGAELGQKDTIRHLIEQLNALRAARKSGDYSKFTGKYILDANIRGLLDELETLNNLEDITDEEREQRIAEINAQLEEQLSIYQAIVKTYADMTGWTMEQKIDASPFANLGDDILSILNDTEKSVEDWKNDIVKMMTEDLIKELVFTDDFKAKIRSLQELYVSAMSINAGDMSSIEDLRKNIEALGYTVGETGKVFDETGKLMFDLSTQEGIEAFLKWLADRMAGLATEAKNTADEVNEAMGTIGNDGQAESAFKNLRDTFKSALTSMEYDAKKFSEDIIDTLIGDLVEKFVLDKPFTVSGLESVWQKAGREVEGRKFANFTEFSDWWNDEYQKILADETLSEEERTAALEKHKKLLEDVLGMLRESADEYIDVWRSAQKGTTFKDMEGNFVSALEDMGKSAEDWAQDVGKAMADRIIQQMVVARLIDPMLEGLDTVFDEAIKANTDEEGVIDWRKVFGNDALQAALNEMYAQFPELQEQIRQIYEGFGVKMDAEFSNGLDSLGDTLLDRLLSLGDDVEDIGKQIGQTLIREMLEQTLSTDQYADRIAAIKKMWQAILTGEDTEHTIEDVLKDIEQLENDITNPENSDFSGLIAKYKSLADVAKEGFSDLRGAFVSALLEMNGDAESFGKQIGRTMLEQMLDAYIDNKWKDEIKALNQEWAEALESGNTEALERIKQKVQELYSTISTDVEVSNIADAIKELDKQLDTTFSDMADSWTSTLMDMETTAEDWAQSVGKMIAEKIIKSMVIPTMIQPILDTMQKAWNAAAEQEGATYQTMLDAMMPYVGQLVGAYEELRPIADYILNSLGVYKETVEEVAEEVEYHLQDLKSNFVSSLMDMEQSAEDWSESISKIMAEAFIKDFVLGDAFDAQMKDWQAHYESILNSGLSEEDRLKQMKLLRDAIVSAKEGYVEQAMAIQELMGLNAASSSQSATANIADKITYEQADQLLGINMAQEMTLEQILYTLRGGIGVTGVGLGLASSSNSETARQIESTLNSMGGLTSSDSETIREIRGLIIIGNSYLYDIKTSNEQMLRQFGERLESIDSKIGQIF